MLGVSLPTPPSSEQAKERLQRIARALQDRHRWKGISYSLVALRWGMVTFTITVVTWSLSLTAMTFPVYLWFLPDDETSGPFRFSDSYELRGAGRIAYVVGVFAIGLIPLRVAITLAERLARADQHLRRRLLSDVSGGTPPDHTHRMPSFEPIASHETTWRATTTADGRFGEDLQRSHSAHSTTWKRSTIRASVATR